MRLPARVMTPLAVRAAPNSSIYFCRWGILVKISGSEASRYMTPETSKWTMEPVFQVTKGRSYLSMSFWMPARSLSPFSPAFTAASCRTISSMAK